MNQDYLIRLRLDARDFRNGVRRQAEYLKSEFSLWIDSGALLVTVHSAPNPSF